MPAPANRELAAAMAAAQLANEGPDLDGVVEQMIANGEDAAPPVDIEALTPERPLGMGGQGARCSPLGRLHTRQPH